MTVGKIASFQNPYHIKNAFQVNFKIFFSRTPLHTSIINGNEAVFELLLSSSVNLEIRTNDGYPPLLYALKQKNKLFAKLLVQKGAPINTVRI
jgi:hypothetical protein